MNTGQLMTQLKKVKALNHTKDGKTIGKID